MRGYRIGRLSVPLTEKEMKKQVESIEGQDKVSKVEINKLKERVDQFKSVSSNNQILCSRKRMQDPTVSTPEVPKRRRLQGTSSNCMVTSTPTSERPQSDEAPANSTGEISCVNSIPSLHSNSPSVMYLNEAVDLEEKSLGECENNESLVNEKSLNPPENSKSSLKCENVDDQVSNSEPTNPGLLSNSPTAILLYEACAEAEKSIKHREIYENGESVNPKCESVENLANDVSNIEVVIERENPAESKVVARLNVDGDSVNREIKPSNVNPNLDHAEIVKSNVQGDILDETQVESVDKVIMESQGVKLVELSKD